MVSLAVIKQGLNWDWTDIFFHSNNWLFCTCDRNGLLIFPPVLRHPHVHLLTLCQSRAPSGSVRVLRVRVLGWGYTTSIIM